MFYSCFLNPKTSRKSAYSAPLENVKEKQENYKKVTLENNKENTENEKKGTNLEVELFSTWCWKICPGHISVISIQLKVRHNVMPIKNMPGAYFCYIGQLKVGHNVMSI